MFDNMNTTLEQYLDGDGIFDVITTTYPLSYMTNSEAKIVDEMVLDELGSLCISPLAVRNSTVDVNHLIVKNPQQVFTRIFFKYQAKWEQLAKVLNLEIEYNPIENYNRTEIRSKNTSAKFKSTSTNKNQGFNSNDYVDNSQVINEGNMNDNATTEGENLSVRGNIGVMSTQDMINQEVELRKKYNFFEELIEDIRTELIFKVY